MDVICQIYKINSSHHAVQKPEQAYANALLLKRGMKRISAAHPTEVAYINNLLSSSSQSSTDEPGIGTGATRTQHFFHKGNFATKKQAEKLRWVWVCVCVCVCVRVCVCVCVCGLLVSLELCVCSCLLLVYICVMLLVY